MTRKKDLPGLVTGLVAILAVALFILLGFTNGNWHIIWLVFLSIPLTAIITDIVFKRKDFAGSIVGGVALLSVAAFLLMGFLLGLWHIAWLVFLLIPLTAILANIFKKPTADEGKEQPKQE